VPSRSLVAPEAGVPGKDLFVNGSKHDEDESDGGELLEDAEDYSETACEFRRTENDRKPFAHADALSPSGGIFQVAPSTGEEDNADHEAEQE